MRWLLAQYRGNGKPRPLVITSGRQPFEVMLLVACVLSGIAGLFGAGSRTIEAVVTPPWALMFHGVLAAAATLTLAGIFLHLPLNLLIERAGLLIMSWLLLTYTAALYGLAARQVGVAGAVIGAFGVASVVRAWQISRDLNKLRIALSNPELAKPPVLLDPSSCPPPGGQQ